MEKQTFVVVANGTHARILLSKEGGPLSEVKELRHSEEGWQEKLSDHAGPTPVDVVGKARHNADAHASPKQKTRASFAKTIADYLAEAHTSGSFKRLYLVASPSFLGDLRRHLNGPVAKAIGGEVDKDLTAHDPAKIRDYLPPVL